jgi:23S rRNA (cytidine1920-2'-O)/16S rRNA (cytidine1409-2'-O)-methyltransferase
MSRQRLDQELVTRGLAPTRSQAESYVKLGQVNVNGKPITKAGFMVKEGSEVNLLAGDRYVSRAGLKLASIAEKFELDFQAKIVLDIGSSTGGFTDYALRHGAKKVIAVDVGSEQLHPSLRTDDRIELHEKTDIRKFATNEKIDIILADVSFISLRQIMPTVTKLANRDTSIIAMVKPQFEASNSGLKHKGVVKNDHMRRAILKDFEVWAKPDFITVDKADSKISGFHGNLERFYFLRKA